jgi:Ca-activated chloride channel family protein
VLPPTPCDAAGRQAATTALQQLRAGGSTNGGAGITLAYQLARGAFRPGGVNRVILATDGDFNVGVTGDGDLVHMVAANARDGIDLTVLGAGTGNLNDAMLEAITNKGNGNYYYLDSPAESRRVFLRKLTGTLVTIARDVKVQVEFNPARVRGYRLLGYANRMLRAQDFADDRVDAGEIGAGHTVTAIYEVETGGARDTLPAAALRYAAAAPHHADQPPCPAASPEWLTVMLRYKRPEGGPSTLVERPFTGLPCDVAAADDDFRFATAVAMTAMLLRADPDLADCRLADARQLAAAALGPDPHGERAGFVTLLDHLAGRPR